MARRVREDRRRRVAKWRTWYASDREFARWFDRLARRSRVTAQEYARVLMRFLEGEGMEPADVVKLARTKKGRRDVEDRVDDLISRLEREGKAPGYILNHVKPLKSWLEHHEIRLVRKFTVTNPNATPTLADEAVPTREQLAAILRVATPRGRVCASFVAYAGLRPEVLGNFHAADGLRVRDLPEIRVGAREVTFAKVPSIVVVRPELSKARHRYFSFLPQEGCDYLAAYLQMRIAAGERLDPDAAIVSVDARARTNGLRGDRGPGAPISTKNVTGDVRDAIRKAGFAWRPYVLRAYFDTRLLLAESGANGNGGGNGGPRLTRDYRSFFMGHKGDIEHRYTLNKGRLPEELVEDMRRAYQAAEPYRWIPTPRPGCTRRSARSPPRTCARSRR